MATEGNQGTSAMGWLVAQRTCKQLPGPLNSELRVCFGVLRVPTSLHQQRASRPSSHTPGAVWASTLPHRHPGPPLADPPSSARRPRCPKASQLPCCIREAPAGSREPAWLKGTRRKGSQSIPTRRPVLPTPPQTPLINRPDQGREARGWEGLGPSV